MDARSSPPLDALRERVQNTEEVRVFQSSLDKRTVTVTPFSQPSFYMALGNAALMALTQRFPEEFVPSKFLTMSYNGIRAPSLLAVPFCVISGGYFMVASVITSSSSPLVGHLAGYSFSLGLGLGCLMMRRISGYYPLLGVMYLSFGGLHHYRKMMLYGDNAPIFYWSDFGRIYNDMRLRRKESKELKKQRRAEAKAIN